MVEGGDGDVIVTEKICFQFSSVKKKKKVFLHNCPPNHETDEIHKSVTSVPEALCPLPAGHVIFFLSRGGGFLETSFGIKHISLLKPYLLRLTSTGKDGSG